MANSLNAKNPPEFPMAPSSCVVPATGRIFASHAALDVVVVPSLYEAQTSFPTGLRRGQTGDCFAVGGIPELVRHEENGLLVQPSTMRSFPELCSGCLVSRFFAPLLLARACELARRELSFDEKAELVLKSYRKALIRRA